MKNIEGRIIVWALIIVFITINKSLGEANMHSCSNRDELMALTGVPTSGIEIEEVDQISNEKYETTVVIIICRETAENALKFFYEGDDHSVFYDPELLNCSIPLCQEILGLHGIERGAIISSTSAVLEMRLEIDGVSGFLPYQNLCFSYYKGEDKHYIIISLVPCELIIDWENVLHEQRLQGNR